MDGEVIAHSGGVQRWRHGREQHRGHPHVNAGEEHGHVSRVTVSRDTIRGHITSVTLVSVSAVGKQSRFSVIFRHVSDV